MCSRSLQLASQTQHSVWNEGNPKFRLHFVEFWRLCRCILYAASKNKQKMTCGVDFLLGHPKQCSQLAHWCSYPCDLLDSSSRLSVCFIQSQSLSTSFQTEVYCLQGNIQVWCSTANFILAMSPDNVSERYILVIYINTWQQISLETSIHSEQKWYR